MTNQPECDPGHAAGTAHGAIPWTAQRALGLDSDEPAEGCYGRTVAGTPCVLPPGHYPASKHMIAMGESWMAWTDEAMADFARIANDLENVHLLDQEHGHAHPHN